MWKVTQYILLYPWVTNILINLLINILSKPWRNPAFKHIFWKYYSSFPDVFSENLSFALHLAGKHLVKCLKKKILDFMVMSSFWRFWGGGVRRLGQIFRERCHESHMLGKGGIQGKDNQLGRRKQWYERGQRCGSGE